MTDPRYLPAAPVAAAPSVRRRALRAAICSLGYALAVLGFAYFLVTPGFSNLTHPQVNLVTGVVDPGSWLPAPLFALAAWGPFAFGGALTIALSLARPIAASSGRWLRTAALALGLGVAASFVVTPLTVIVGFSGNLLYAVPAAFIAAVPILLGALIAASVEESLDGRHRPTAAVRQPRAPRSPSTRYRSLRGLAHVATLWPTMAVAAIVVLVIVRPSPDWIGWTMSAGVGFCVAATISILLFSGTTGETTARRALADGLVALGAGVLGVLLVVDAGAIFSVPALPSGSSYVEVIGTSFLAAVLAAFIPLTVGPQVAALVERRLTRRDAQPA